MNSTATFLCVLALWVCAAGASHAADPVRGQALYEARCFGCHSIDAHRIGPLHRGLIGRRAGSVADFDYSPALRASRVVWSAATLDAWLADPQAFIPGQRMNVRVADATDRADLVAYLLSQGTH